MDFSLQICSASYPVEMASDIQYRAEASPTIVLKYPTLPLKLLRGIPEVFFEIDNLIIHHLYAFGFEQLLHHVGTAKSVLASEHAHAVYHTMCRHSANLRVRCPHGPAHHSRRTAHAQITRDGTVAGNATIRNLHRHLMHLLKKVDLFH